MFKILTHTQQEEKIKKGHEGERGSFLCINIFTHKFQNNKNLCCFNELFFFDKMLF